ncbi:hypothetical protein Tco_1528691, partial [Tanacetum coccineum]
TLVLVNGIPTFEFSIKRGLRQEDPLSPFLFILVMEGLHVVLLDVVQSCLIHGVKCVSAEEVSHMANNTGFASGSFPIVYLGLSIGINMNLTSNWKILIDECHARLST